MGKGKNGNRPLHPKTHPGLASQQERRFDVCVFVCLINEGVIELNNSIWKIFEQRLNLSGS